MDSIKIRTQNSNSKGVTSQENDRNRTEAERESQTRFNASQEQIKQIARDQEVQKQALENAYVRDFESTDDRNQHQLNSLKLKGYEEIREQIRKNQAELSRIKREGEREIAQLDEFYKTGKFQKQSTGDKEIEDLFRKYEQQKSFTQSAGSNDLEFMQKDYSLRAQEMKELKEHQFQNLTQDNSTQLDQLRANKQALLEKTHDTYQDQYKTIFNTQNKELALLSHDASQKLKDLRLTTSHQLKSYTDRQTDPFYKLFKINADIQETDNAFILKAKIPEHEQRHVTVVIRGGNQLVISGRRQNEEKSEPIPGNVQRSSSFQSFSESFPLNFPVDSQKLSKIFIGDQLTVTLPKKNMSLQDLMTPIEKKPAVTYAKAEKPQFPDNLPSKDKLEETRTAEFEAAQTAREAIKRSAGKPFGTA